MSISRLCRGYFPLSFTNSDIICSFIAARPGQPPLGQIISQIAQTVSEGRPGQTLSEIPTGRVRILLEISGNIRRCPDGGPDR